MFICGFNTNFLVQSISLTQAEIYGAIYLSILKRKTGKHDEQGSTEESDDVEEEFFTIAGLFEEVDNEHDEEENNSTKVTQSC